MRAPVGIQEFATLCRVAADDVERYTSLGLLDPDGDGRFDEYDALRLFWVELEIARGRSPEEMAHTVSDPTSSMPYFGDLLYPRGPMRPIEQVAPDLGLTPDELDQISVATGIPVTRMLDEADVQALRTVRLMVGAGFPFEAILDVCRVLGDAFRRIAQTEVRLMHEHVHQPLVAQGMSEEHIMEREAAIIAAMAPVMEPVLGFIHKQFLMRAVTREILDHRAGSGAEGSTLDVTILFVDLSSFTSLAAVHGDAVAADIVRRFDEIVRAHAMRHAGMLVKQIGDEFMLTFNDQADAVRFSVALTDAAAKEDGFPALRIGMHAGPVLYRVGDYIGNTVNIASRVAGSAAAGEILMSEAAAHAAGEAGIGVEPAGVRMLRGLGDPITLFRVARTRAAVAARDPVCGMTVEDPATRLVRDDKTFVFCSEACLRAFVEAPDRYVSA